MLTNCYCSSTYIGCGIHTHYIIFGWIYFFYNCILYLNAHQTSQTVNNRKKGCFHLCYLSLYADQSNWTKGSSKLTWLAGDSTLWYTTIPHSETCFKYSNYRCKRNHICISNLFLFLTWFWFPSVEHLSK